MPIHNLILLDAARRPSPILLEARGPLLPVEVNLHPAAEASIQRQGGPLPQPVTGYGLIDTGASISAVDQKAVAQLGIPPVGTAPVATAAGSQQQGQHPATIGFPGTPLPTISFAFVFAADLEGQDLVALIGRDVLRHFIAIYNGSLGQVTLTI